MLTRKNFWVFLKYFLGILLVFNIIQNFKCLHLNYKYEKNVQNLESSAQNFNIPQKLLAPNLIKSLIEKNNSDQKILNGDKFEPLKPDHVVIVVQVHNRIEYLIHLIKSFSTASDIAEALIIFSHDFYNDEINSVVQSINFCRVLQIFFPYSIQIHPNEFPGRDPNDCNRDMNKIEAARIRCNNFDSPDSYGHYREGQFTQLKHHWWWKINQVFDELKVSKDHKGLVLFLEDDHYVAPDFLHVLKVLKRKTSAECDKCNVLVLGNYEALINEYTFQVKNHYTTPWISSKHNMGMAFNRSVWNQIKDCANLFCTYDDYNWDWSLQITSENCAKQKLHVMGVVASRVFHLGECGTHAANKNNCNINDLILKLESSIETAKKSKILYPEELGPESVTNQVIIPVKNGGWNDNRDHTMCMNMVSKN